MAFDLPARGLVFWPVGNGDSSSNKPGDNPPHAKAKTQYETITDSFLCTMDQDDPIVAELKDGSIVVTGIATASMSASQAADDARGSSEPPAGAYTYGRG